MFPSRCILAKFLARVRCILPTTRRAQQLPEGSLHIWAKLLVTRAFSACPPAQIPTLAHKTTDPHRSIRRFSANRWCPLTRKSGLQIKEPTNIASPQAHRNLLCPEGFSRGLRFWDLQERTPDARSVLTPFPFWISLFLFYILAVLRALPFFGKDIKSSFGDFLACFSKNQAGEDQGLDSSWTLEERTLFGLFPHSFGQGQKTTFTFST